MKKLFFTAVLALGTIFGSQAQEILDNAIGLRFNSSMGGAEISYQRKISDSNRIEADLAFSSGSNIINKTGTRHTYIGVMGIYQWTFHIQNGFHWYIGPAAGVGMFSYSTVINGQKYSGDTNAALYIGGNAGIEYNFDIPLQISIDIRPQFNLLNTNEGFYYRDMLALSARYKF